MVKGLLRTWVENGYYGLERGTMAVINLKLKKKSSSTRMEAVDTLCPRKGPLLELEETLFNEALNHLYAEGKISLENYLLCKLTLVFGVRPIQLSKLTIKNLLVEQSTAGKNYGLLIPWAKQKIDNRPPIYFPLTQHLGAMLFLQVERIRMRFPKDSLMKGMTWEGLPFFPNLQEKTPIPWSADCISQIIARIGKKANILNQRAGGGSTPIKINPQRLRHTVGTRLATRGEYGARDIAHYLLHADIQSPRSYVDLKEVLLKNFNRYWQVRLEANAKVALGIIDSEEAKRMKGPRITFSEDGRHRRGIGKCGKTGCKVRVPLACYGCAKFRPLLDAPHHEYLQTLLTERDRQLEVAPKHIGVFDTAIWYVRRVIEACNQIRSGEE